MQNMWKLNEQINQVFYTKSNKINSYMAVMAVYYK